MERGLFFSDIDDTECDGLVPAINELYEID